MKPQGNILLLSVLFFQTITLFSQPENKLIPYRLGDKWGYSDINGKVLITPAYDFVYLFENQYAKVRLNNKYGKINALGKITIPIIYDRILSCGGGINIVILGEVSKDLYDNGSIYPVNKKYVIAPPLESNSYEEKINRDLNAYEAMGNVGLRDDGYDNYQNKKNSPFERGFKYPATFRYMERDTNYVELTYVSFENRLCIYAIDRHHRHGLLDENKHPVIPCRYDLLTYYEGKIIAESGAVKGIFNVDGKALLDVKYYFDNSGIKEQYLKISEKDHGESKHGVFDNRQSIIIIPPDFNDVKFLAFKDDFHFLVKRIVDRLPGVQWQLLNSHGLQVTTLTFDQVDCYYFRNKESADSAIFIGYVRGAANLYDVYGKPGLKGNYSSIKFAKSDWDHKVESDLLFASRILSASFPGLKYGLINLKDSILLNFEYDDLKSCDSIVFYFYKFRNHLNTDRLFYFKQDNLWGIVTINNKIIVIPEYKEIKVLAGTPLAYVTLPSGQKGFINMISGIKYFKE